MKKKVYLKLKWRIAIMIIVFTAVSSLFVSQPSDTLSIFGTTASLNSADIAWLLTASCLVLLMTPGLSFFYGGMVGKKNIISTMLQSFASLGVITVLWVVIGFGLAFGDPIGFSLNGTYYGVIGNPSPYLYFNNLGLLPHKELAPTIPFLLFALFQLKFAIITPAIITGSFAERVRFVGYLLFIALFSLFIYTPLCHMIWHPSGLLGSYFGIVDFAGGTVVHMSAGFAALAGAIYIGKRENRHYNPTNIPFVILGTGMLWFGWFGFNAGSAFAANENAVLAFATTTAASAMAMLTWLFVDKFHGRKLSALGACIGAVVGLVAITPAAGVVTVAESLFFGFFAAIVSNFFAHWHRLKSLDDTLDVFACHGVGGIMGMVLTAIFARVEGASLLHGGGWSVLFSHLFVLILVACFTFFGSLLLYKIVNSLITLRVDAEKEALGLDVSQHGESYADWFADR